MLLYFRKDVAKSAYILVNLPECFSSIGGTRKMCNTGLIEVKHKTKDENEDKIFQWVDTGYFR